MMCKEALQKESLYVYVFKWNGLDKLEVHAAGRRVQCLGVEVHCAWPPDKNRSAI